MALAMKVEDAFVWNRQDRDQVPRPSDGRQRQNMTLA
jgi:hypothetical protein